MIRTTVDIAVLPIVHPVFDRILADIKRTSIPPRPVCNHPRLHQLGKGFECKDCGKIIDGEDLCEQKAEPFPQE